MPGRARTGRAKRIDDADLAALRCEWRCRVGVYSPHSKLIVEMRETVPWVERFDPMKRPHDRSVAVLVVEDEYLIRMDTASSLEVAGFTAFEAENAAEAIRCLDSHAEIRLIFTDVNMPGSMDGLALAHYVRGRWPPVKIIVTSGYMKIRHDDLPAGALFVEKPYYPKNIAQRINELIAA